MVKRLLMIVDVQRGFLTDATRHVPETVTRLQRDFDEVVATRFVNPPGSFHRRLIHWERFAPGSADTDLAFVPRPDALVTEKSTYTCLTAPVSDLLRNQGIGTVYLCGIATDNCVLKTAVDLFENRIRPVILSRACGSHGGDACHQAGLILLRRMVGAGQVFDGPLDGFRAAEDRSD